MTRTAPRTSRPGAPARAGVRATSRGTSTSAATATGMLIRKIQRQVEPSTSAPDTIGPLVPASPEMPPNRPMALVRSRGVGEQQRDEAEGGRRGQGLAQPLREAGADERPGGLARARSHRGHAEHRDADEEHPASAEDVAEPAAEQQQAARHEHVAVHDPGEAGLGEAEVALDRRERDVHDADVEDEHELHEQQHGEGPPAAWVGAAPCGAADGSGAGVRGVVVTVLLGSGRSAAEAQELNQ